MVMISIFFFEAGQIIRKKQSVCSKIDFYDNFTIVS